MVHSKHPSSSARQGWGKRGRGGRGEGKASRRGSARVWVSSTMLVDFQGKTGGEYREALRVEGGESSVVVNEFFQQGQREQESSSRWGWSGAFAELSAPSTRSGSEEEGWGVMKRGVSLSVSSTPGRCLVGLQAL